MMRCSTARQGARWPRFGRRSAIGFCCSRPVLEDASVSSAAPAPCGEEHHEQPKHANLVCIILCRRSRPRRPPPVRSRREPDCCSKGRSCPRCCGSAAPNVLNLLAIAGMITFDGLFLGRLGPDALAGVSLAFPFVMLIQHTAASGMGGGVSSAIARALGAGKRDVADALALHTFVLALGLAAAFSTVLLLGAPFDLSMDGRAWRNAVVRARLRERGVQRRSVHLHAESARQRRARDRQHGPARRRHRRQRDRARARSRHC